MTESPVTTETSEHASRSSGLNKQVDVGRAFRRLGAFLAEPGRASIALVILGLVIRVTTYWDERPYWLDEDSLVGNIQGRSPWDVMSPLGGTQLAPPGFLIVERIVAATLGAEPWALRLFPMVAGVSALFLFAGLARTILTPWAAVWAIGLFALCDEMIYFSNEVKPYIFDVLGTLLVLGLVVDHPEAPRSPRAIADWLVRGVSIVWFSFPTIFVMAVVGLWSWARALTVRDLRGAIALTGIGLAWLGSFAAVRVIAMANLDGSEAMWEFWDGCFLSRPWESTEAAGAFAVRLLNVFVNPRLLDTPAGLAASAGFGLVLTIVGAGSLIARRRAATAAILLAPMVPLAIASMARLYPYHGRLILVLAPGLLMVMAEGIGRLLDGVRNRPARMVLTIALVCWLFAAPLIRQTAWLEGGRIRPFDPCGDLHQDLCSP